MSNIVFIGGDVGYDVLDGSSNANLTVSGAGLIATGNSANCGGVRTFHGKSAGKWYFEGVLTTNTAGVDSMAIGVGNSAQTATSLGYSSGNGWGYWAVGGSGFRNAGLVLSSSASQGDVLGFAVDLDNGKIWASKNGTWIQGDPSTNTSPLSTNLSASAPIYPIACCWKAGHVITMRFDPASHSYSTPTGFTPGWTAAS